MAELLRQANAERMNDGKLYWVAAPNGWPIQLEWSLMSRTQKEGLLLAEQRAAYTEEFQIYS
jgi:hypothetical protein